ncbi:MAG: sulfotransferase family protein [Flavobacteriaceae bacterium]|nr:sulfotransferase family protein [Flavobacteriaceae bacterium]
MSTKRICLWSGPRNISTTLMYSFAQRKDTKVFDEPLYAHYLSKTEAKNYHPVAKEIIATMENDGEKVIRMMMGKHETPIVFFKNMTHHLLAVDRDFMKDCINIILIRDPVEMLPSFEKVIKNPKMIDVGYALTTELYDYLRGKGIPPIILDARKVLLNPRKVLKKLCHLIGIAFDEAMLRWKAGARPEDGIWAPYFYGNIHRSTGYIPYQPKTEPFPEKLIPLLKECKPHYEQLRNLALE